MLAPGLENPKQAWQGIHFCKLFPFCDKNTRLKGSSQGLGVGSIAVSWV